MTAGMVKVPTIVPLRPPSNGRKNMIDSRTAIEILSDTEGAIIYYTTNGTKPNPFQTIGKNFTYRYYKPFVLASGRKTVKAMATTSDGTRESSIVTKRFIVDESVQQHSDEVDILEELDENQDELNHLSNFTKWNSWTNENDSHMNPPNHGKQKPNGKRFNRNKDVSSPEYLSLLLDRPSHEDNFDDGQEKRESVVELNKCIYCFAPWPSDPYSTYCNDCGSLLPQTSTSQSLMSNPEKNFSRNVTTPPLPQENEPLITCPKCFRVNNGEARFCDWCGSKPLPYASYLTCSNCNGNNQPYSKYCSMCGCLIDAPPRRCANSVLATLVEKKQIEKNLNGDCSLTWIPVDVPRLSSETVNQATQTSGLFYPSSTSLTKQQKLEADTRARNDHYRHGKPLFSAVSPGRGYWRQQIDHICSHLRAYAQNEAEFRKLIGEPKMGKLVATKVDEDYEDEKITVSVTFALRNKNDGQSKTKHEEQVSTTYQNSETFALETRLRFADNLSSQEKRKSRKKAQKRSHPVKSFKKTNETRLLFEELGQSGEGNPENVQRLLNEGADVNAENSKGMRILSMAVQHNHLNCIPVLVKEGAQLNHQSTDNGNSVLHEAVLKGADVENCLDVLLRCGVNTKLTNKTGASAYDLALKSGKESIIKKFTTNIGQELLLKLTKKQSQN
ncbi:double zinc ribbon and ankyrin repeat-containing protein 1-like [Xenia sp. Carnegie-2017]|uniref:double zinc ribbon and ankyrin repeat-containing protein 1-like n=1 Tax=Xenia sp. Carnegie-2017 TaxID=2897299 RepID=UPI001F0420E5|nr:double zinc ribbon and ankyrin repeat-containing protein 1-like [Xenia sp. Carnegie-2017]